MLNRTGPNTNLCSFSLDTSLDQYIAVYRNSFGENSSLILKRYDSISVQKRLELILRDNV